jgi:hypothetical protein
MLPSKSSPSSVSCYDVLVICILIGGVCFLTLTPAMYLTFQALQWPWATRMVEAAFFPSLLLSVAAGLLAYKRAQARRMSSEDHVPDD